MADEGKRRERDEGREEVESCDREDQTGTRGGGKAVRADATMSARMQSQPRQRDIADTACWSTRPPRGDSSEDIPRLVCRGGDDSTASDEAVGRWKEGNGGRGGGREGGTEEGTAGQRVPHHGHSWVDPTGPTVVEGD